LGILQTVVSHTVKLTHTKQMPLCLELLVGISPTVLVSNIHVKTTFRKFDVRGSVQNTTVQKEKCNKMQQCIKNLIISYLYESQHVSGETPPIIRSLKLHWQPLVFHTCMVVGRVVCWTCLTTSIAQPSQQPATKNACKTTGCNYSF
jgi:hypothetical protein